MPSMTKSAIIHTLERTITQLEGRLEAYTQQSNRLANVRLLIILLLGGPTAVLAFIGPPWSFWAGLALTAAVFLPVSVVHRRLKTGIDRFTIWRDIKEEQVARARLNWARIPPTERTTRPTHPYEQDIDLIDLHRLLNVGESRGGRDRLYNWLTVERPQPEDISARQAALHELIPRRIFRDKLTLAARQGASDLDEEGSIDQWLSNSSMPPVLPLILAAMSVLAVLNWGLFGAFLAGVLPPVFVITLVLYATGFLLQMPHTLGMFQEAAGLLDRLRMLAGVTTHIETASYTHAPHLREIATPILTDHPSDDLRRLSLLAGAAALQGNPYVWILLNVIGPWDAGVGLLLYRQKAILAERLPRWVDVWYTLEALSSLATFAYLNPAATFPTVQADITPIFAAQHIGHPLIPDQVRVSNDFQFTQAGEVVIITGSNMSGKSSFLRTLGVNLRMAYAGGVVCADRLAARPMRMFSSIRVTDSLEDGISFFYAEVKRLRALLEAFEAPDDMPLFYMIDEIFRGTNNRERLIGSRAYIEALVGGNGVGLVATHDLELVQLAEGEPLIRNMHFREEIADGRMAFDYTLRPGPCPTTNALTIMAMEGLPVEP